VVVVWFILTDNDTTPQNCFKLFWVVGWVVAIYSTVLMTVDIHDFSKSVNMG
jgi:hypothetical protein